MGIYQDLTGDQIYGTGDYIKLQVLNIYEKYLIWDIEGNCGDDKVEDWVGEDVKDWNRELKEI